MKKPCSLHKRIKKRLRAIRVRRRKLAERQRIKNLRNPQKMAEKRKLASVDEVLKHAMPIKVKKTSSVGTSTVKEGQASIGGVQEIRLDHKEEQSSENKPARQTRKRTTSTAKKVGKVATGTSKATNKKRTSGKVAK